MALFNQNVWIKSLSLFALGVGLLGCEEALKSSSEYYEIVQKHVVVDVPANGVLEAKVSTAISIPANVFEPQLLSWLEEENTYVKKGQVIARLDPTKYLYQTKVENFKKEQIKLDSEVKKGTLTNEEKGINSDHVLIKKELIIAEQYTVEDERLFSKNEIIDKMKNKGFLDARLVHNKWQKDGHENRSTTELQLLELQEREVDAKVNMYQQSLNKMEITAPHDGIFLLERNWRGEKTNVGALLFPGSKFAVLPELTKMQARLYVLENESANLKEGQVVRMKLDAYVDFDFDGTITTIEPVAKVLSKSSPVKYLQVIVDIAETDVSKMRPGDRLKARIVLDEKENAIAVPSTAIFEKNNESYVQVGERGDKQVRKVKAGTKGTAMTIIHEGLSLEDRVLIFPDSGLIK